MAVITLVIGVLLLFLLDSHDTQQRKIASSLESFTQNEAHQMHRDLGRIADSLERIANTR